MKFPLGKHGTTEGWIDLRIERLDELLYFIHLRFWHHVRLVEQDDIGKFDLIGQTDISICSSNANREDYPPNSMASV